MRKIKHYITIEGEDTNYTTWYSYYDDLKRPCFRRIDCKHGDVYDGNIDSLEEIFNRDLKEGHKVLTEESEILKYLTMYELIN